MEVAFGGGTFAKEDTRYILIASCGITLECESDAGCLWYLGCKWRRDGMKVMLNRTKVLDEEVSMEDRLDDRKLDTMGICRPLPLLSS